MSVVLLVAGIILGLLVGGWLGLAVAALGLLASIAWFEQHEKR